MSCSSFFILLCSALGLGKLTVWTWAATPDKWLCEYGQAPTSIHKAKARSMQPYTMFFCFIYFTFILQIFLHTHSPFIALLHIALLFCLLQLSISDLKFHILQDEWIGAIVILGFIGPGNLILKFKECLVPAVLCTLALLVYEFFDTPPPLGMGDAKLFLALGFYFGLAGLFFVFCLSLLCAGIWGSLLLIFKKATKKDRIPLGPFIAISCVYFIFSTLSI